MSKTTFVILDDIEKPPEMNEEIKNIFFNGRHHILPKLEIDKQRYILYDNYNNFTQADIERILDIPNDHLIDWLLTFDKESFQLTNYHKQTITAIMTKIECGVGDYKDKSIEFLIDCLIQFWYLIKESLDPEQLNGVISDNIIENAIIEICFRKHLYNEDVIAPTASDIRYGLSKIKNSFYIEKMNNLAKYYNIDI